MDQVMFSGELRRQILDLLEEIVGQYLLTSDEECERKDSQGDLNALA